MELVNDEYLAHIHLLNLSILRFQGIWCQNYDRPLTKLGELKFFIIEVEQGVCQICALLIQFSEQVDSIKYHGSSRLISLGQQLAHSFDAPFSLACTVSNSSKI